MSSRSNELAFYGLPSKVVFCKSCVISNQRPSSSVEFKHKTADKKSTIEFDNGICAACKYQTQKSNIIDWKDRDEQLLELLRKHRSNSGGSDVIVPGSGGKDSAYTSHILKYKYNMNSYSYMGSIYTQTLVGKTLRIGITLVVMIIFCLLQMVNFIAY